MIDEVFVFLKNQLDQYLYKQSGYNPAAENADLVTFPDGEKIHPIVFKLNAVTLLLINFEIETTVRSANPYRRTAANGSSYQIQPAIPINLSILFVSNSHDYKQSLGQLSRVIQFFQSNPVFTRENAPALDQRIEKLVMELISLPLADQLNLWSSLQTTYLPSVLYKVRMLVFEDRNPPATTPVSETVIDVEHAKRSDS
jgi:hypothetical protein